MNGESLFSETFWVSNRVLRAWMLVPYSPLLVENSGLSKEDAVGSEARLILDFVQGADKPLQDERNRRIQKSHKNLQKEKDKAANKVRELLR